MTLDKVKSSIPDSSNDASSDRGGSTEAITAECTEFEVAFAIAQKFSGPDVPS